MPMLGSQPVFEVKPAKKPNGSPQSGVTQGFYRIPVCMVVDGDGVGWHEQKDEKSGTPRKDMTSKTTMTFGTHSGILSKCRCIGASACMHEVFLRMLCVRCGVLCTGRAKRSGFEVFYWG